MKKVFITFLFVVLLSGSFSAYAIQRQLPRLVDQANLLTPGERTVLESRLDEISQQQQCDVVVVAVNSLEGKTATEFADDFYDYNGFGMGSNDDGILFLICKESRDWAISTHGFGIEAFNDAGQEYIFEQIKSDLGSDYFNSAFLAFAGLCEDFLVQARAGEPYNNSSLPDKPFSPGLWLLISLAVGAVVALIGTGIMRGKLKSVRDEKFASNYFVNDSLLITDSRDIHLYTRVDRRERPKNTSSGVHSSSSGRSHGGSSGKF